MLPSSNDKETPGLGWEERYRTKKKRRIQESPGEKTQWEASRIECPDAVCRLSPRLKTTLWAGVGEKMERGLLSSNHPRPPPSPSACPGRGGLLCSSKQHQARGLPLHPAPRPPPWKTRSMQCFKALGRPKRRMAPVSLRPGEEIFCPEGAECHAAEICH